MNLRNYRFEASAKQPSAWIAPGLAEQPGKYPGIKIETGVGSFALVATVTKYDEYGPLASHRVPQLYHDAAQALSTGEAAARTINYNNLMWSGGAIIPLGRTLKRQLSAYQHEMPPVRAHLLDHTEDGVYGGVVQRGQLYAIAEDAYEVADLYKRHEDAYAPVMAVFSDRPNTEQRRAGETPIAIQSLVPEATWDWLATTEVGTIVIPSLLRTDYCYE